MIDLAYIEEVKSKDYSDIYQKICEKTLEILHINDDIELSVILVNDERIHEINRDYRHIDKSTDVISFALEDNEQCYIEGMPRILGDIFISVEHASMQAKDYGHSIDREMCFLFTHGLLHLLGYDHMTKEEEIEMFQLQDDILKVLDINREV